MTKAEHIFELKEKGYSYRDMNKEFGYSKGTISYHLGKGQKEKNNQRQIKLRKEKPILRKVERYLRKPLLHKDNIIKEDFVTSPERLLYKKVYDFNKKDFFNNNRRRNKNLIMKFTANQLIEREGDINNITCEFTGEKIDINDTKSYELDHLLPASRPELFENYTPEIVNGLDNCVFVKPVINRMKSDQTYEELIENCIKILKHANYNITKN